MQTRTDEISAARIDTALLLERMLGQQEALGYLRAAALPDALIERVLDGGPRRPASVAATLDPAAMSLLSTKFAERFYANTGRRHDAIRSAVVQAALSLRAELGSERVEQLLRREALPDAVIQRVMNGQHGTLRARYAPSAPA